MPDDVMINPLTLAYVLVEMIIKPTYVITCFAWWQLFFQCPKKCRILARWRQISSHNSGKLNAAGVQPWLLIISRWQTYHDELHPFTKCIKTGLGLTTDSTTLLSVIHQISYSTSSKIDNQLLLAFKFQHRTWPGSWEGIYGVLRGKQCLPLSRPTKTLAT